MDKSVSVECVNGSYGNFCEDCPASCQYFESCRFYTSSPDPDNQKKIRNAVSLEKNVSRIYVQDTGNREEQQQSVQANVNLESLADILRYILTLEDSTVATISELLKNPGIRQSELARKRNVSRQRINTSLLHICRAHPELAKLFVLCVQKVTLAHNRYQKQKSYPGDLHPDLF